MNREAAALGVPVYSIFRGPIGAVDRHLAAAGRLTLVESVEDVGRKIGFRPRSPHVPADIQTSRALEEIVGHIEKVIMSRTGEVRASMEHRDW